MLNHDGIQVSDGIQNANENVSTNLCCTKIAAFWWST